MLQVYTGEGKGKTTAAVGLAVRAAKHYKVLFIQVIKDGKSSEISNLRRLPNIMVKAFGSGKRIILENGNADEKKKVKNGIKYVKNEGPKYDIVIIDEALTAIGLGLLKTKVLLQAVRGIKNEKEVVLTGHGLPKEISEEADLVTEMRLVKHYYQKGVKARKGIEY